ncbi:hypothetical protein D047_4666B, partial [Vibrio parahaemolyticus VPTS-2010_2]
GSSKSLEKLLLLFEI